MPRRQFTKPNFRLRLVRGKRRSIYYIDWTEAKRPKSVSTRTGDREAAERQRAALEAGWNSEPIPEQPTIGKIIGGYLANRKGHVRDYARLEITAKALRRHFDHLQPEFLTRRVYWQKRKSDGVSNGTILHDGIILRAALAWAVKERWIKEAPYVELPPKPPPRDRFLSREEADKLIAACKAPHIRLFVLLALNTAARKGALLDLTWERVDLAAKLIHLRVPGHAQTTKRRATVPINSRLLAPLQEARDHAASAYVIEFHGAKAGNPKKAFERAVERAGVAPCTPHTLRHTAASWMAMAGVPVEQIARFLGDTIAMVERTYAKFTPDYLRSAADALAGIDSQNRNPARNRPRKARQKRAIAAIEQSV